MEKQLTFGQWLRQKNDNPRLAGWHMYVLGQIRSPTEIKKLRTWCTENLTEDYKIKPERIITPLLEQKKCIGCVVWIKGDDDALLLKLRWHDFQ